MSITTSPHIARRWIAVASASAIGLTAIAICLTVLLGADTTGPARGKIFYQLIRQHDALALWPFLGIAAVALFLAIQDRDSPLFAIAGYCAQHPARLAIGVLVTCTAGGVTIFRQQPLSMDEYLPVFQSQVFLEGRLRALVPTDLVDRVAWSHFQGRFFKVDHRSGEIASMYWPAFALLQSPFAALHANWLINPVVTAFTVLAMNALLRHLRLPDVLRGAALLATAASPAILLNGMASYATPLILLCNVIYTRLILEGSPRSMFAAGFVGSVGLTAVNPLPHMLYAVPWIVWITLRRRGGWRDLGWLVAGYAPLTLLLGYGWAVLLDQMDAIAASADRASRLRVFALPTMSVAVSRLWGVVKLDLWAVPALVPLAVAGGLCWTSGVARCFTASAALTLVGYLFVPFDQGHGWGYRYFHAAWLTLPILAVGGIYELSAAPRLRQAALMLLIASGVASAVILLPLRGWQASTFVTEHLRQLPQWDEQAGRQIIFITPQCGYYIEDLIQNEPSLRTNDLRFVSMGEQADRDLALRILGDARPSGSNRCASRWVAAAPAGVRDADPRAPIVRE